MTQQLRNARIARLILRRERNAVVRRFEVDVLGGEEIVGGSQEADALRGERGLEVLDRLQEDKTLATVEGLDIRSRGGEGL